MDRYITVTGKAEAQYEVMKSRFLTYVQYVQDEPEVLAALQFIKKQHWEATHNCSAYIIGEQKNFQKADDDGEPSGTAGKPILEVLKKTGLCDVLIVVTRYFGGIKLGAGGLIRAYGKAATLGLAASQWAEKKRYRRIGVDIDYTLLGSVENQLRLKKYAIESKDFTATVRLVILAAEKSQEQCVRDLTEWTAGRCSPEDLGGTIIDAPIPNPFS